MDLNSLINKLKDLFSISIDKEINLDVDISDEKEQPIQSQTIIPDGQPIEKSKDITDIGYKAFSHNTELDSFTIPNHVEIIHSYDFWNCTNLTSIFIHKGVCKIGEGSFSGCTKLTSVTLPDNIIGIGKNAFWNCWQLSSINLPKKLTEIQAGILRNCYNLTSIIIPDNITYIGQNAFKGCEKLSSIIIPDKVTFIDEFAFWGCRNLVTITLSSNLKKIETCAWGNCNALFEIHSKNKIPPTIKDNTFSKTNYIECKLFVPVGSYKDYRQAMGWCEFKQIIEE